MSFCFLSTMRFQLGTPPPRGTVGCATLPFRVIFRHFAAYPATMVACGKVFTLVSLVIPPAFSFNSHFFVSPPPATLVVRGRLFTVVCLIIAPSSSRPPRHAGGTREVFDCGLPYYGACVSFNYSSSRFSWLHSEAVQRCGSGF